MEEIKLHSILISIISITLIILIGLGSIHNLSQVYRFQALAKTSSNQIVHRYYYSTTMNSTTDKNNTIDKRAIAINQTINNKMSTDQLGSPSNGVRSNTQRYIDQLNNSTSSQIAAFPINDLAPETITTVLKGLSLQSLYKVLSSISADDLSTLLQNKLPPDQTNKILDKLPQNQKTNILSRIIS